MYIVKCFIVNVHAPSGSRNFCPRTTYPATRMTESTLTSVSWTTLSGTTPASSPGGKSKGGKQLAVVRRRRKLSSNSARASATTKAFSTTLLTSSYCLEILARRGFIRWGRLMAIQQSFAKLCCNFNEVPTVLLADRVLFKLRQIREHTVSKNSIFCLAQQRILLELSSAVLCGSRVRPDERWALLLRFLPWLARLRLVAHLLRRAELCRVREGGPPLRPVGLCRQRGRVPRSSPWGKVGGNRSARKYLFIP